MDAPAGPYALHMACLSNEYDTVKRLLGEGASLLTRWEGRSPLTLAVAGDPAHDLRVVDLLLARGEVPRSYPANAPGAEDDAFDAALGCTHRRADILLRLLRRTTSPLCGAQRIFDAAALFSVDVMREVLLCRTGSAHHGTGVAAYLDEPACINAFYAAVVTHGLPAVGAAVLPLMTDVLAVHDLCDAWDQIMVSFDSDAHKLDLPDAHAALARQLAHSLGRLDLDYLVAMDTDVRIIDELVTLGMTHSCLNPDDPARRHIPRIFSAIRAGSPDALHAALDGLSDDERAAALCATDRLRQSPLSRAICRADPIMVEALVHEGVELPFTPDCNAMYFLPTKCRKARTCVDDFVVRTDLFSMPALVIAALNAFYGGLRCEFLGVCGDAAIDARMDEANSRAVRVLRTLLQAHADACGMGPEIDLAVIREEYHSSEYSHYQTEVVEVIHVIFDSNTDIPRSSRFAMLQFCAAELCSDSNLRLCVGHTPVSLLFGLLYDGQPRAADPFAGQDAERLLSLFIRDVDTSIEWRMLQPTTSAMRSDTERGGEPELCSTGAMLAYHLRVPERLLTWRTPSASGGGSTLTSYLYWPKLVALTKRDWPRRCFNEVLAAARCAGAWWLQPQFRAILTSNLSGALLAPRACQCALCRSGQSVPRAAYQLQLAAAGYVTDASQGKLDVLGLSYFTCAAGQAMYISDEELRAAWPALLHAAVFYCDGNTNTRDFPDCFLIDELWGGNPSYFACRALWFNVFSAAVRLRDADALRLAAWFVTAGNSNYVAEVEGTADPVGSALQAAVMLVADTVKRRLLPASCFADLMDAARYADRDIHSRGIENEPFKEGFGFSLMEMRPAGRLLRTGRTRHACAVLRAGATSERDQLFSAVSEDYFDDDSSFRFWPGTVRMAPRLHAAFGAAGWARRKHALAARARARWAQWTAAAVAAEVEPGGAADAAAVAGAPSGAAS